jgi:hypothetical protein
MTVVLNTNQGSAGPVELPAQLDETIEVRHIGFVESNQPDLAPTSMPIYRKTFSTASGYIMWAMSIDAKLTAPVTLQSLLKTSAGQIIAQTEFVLPTGEYHNRLITKGWGAVGGVTLPAGVYSTEVRARDRKVGEGTFVIDDYCQDFNFDPISGGHNRRIGDFPGDDRRFHKFAFTGSIRSVRSPAGCELRIEIVTAESSYVLVPAPLNRDRDDGTRRIVAVIDGPYPDDKKAANGLIYEGRITSCSQSINGASWTPCTLLYGGAVKAIHIYGMKKLGMLDLGLSLWGGDKEVNWVME